MGITLLSGVNRLVQLGMQVQGVRSRLASVGGHKVQFYDLPGRGVGPPVFLVHGVGGSGLTFGQVMVPLAERFSRVVALDLPGSGLSAAPSKGPLSIDEQRRLLQDFARQELRMPALWVGNSLGGAESLLAALDEPALLRGLVLLCPAGAEAPQVELDALVRDMEVKDVRSALAITRRLYHRAPLHMLLFAPQMKQLYGTATVHSTLHEFRDAHLFTPAALSKLKVPTLLLWGGSEKLLPASGVDFFRAHLPSSVQVEVVQGFGHVPHLEKPLEVAQRIRAFAQQQRW